MREPRESDSLLKLANNEDSLSSRSSDGQTTGQRILGLAVPAAAALLIDPLMTLTDTVFVGRFSENADQLAGMGSAAALLTFSFYLFNFLCTATTPLVAQKRAAGNERLAVALGRQALSLSIVLGCTLAVILLVFDQPLLRLMGTGQTGEFASQYALAFLSIRALAAPAILCIEACVGVLRGYLDTKTPIVVLVVSNIINLLLDIALIAWLGLGPMGAAIATTTAEWISAALFLAVLAGVLPSAAGELGRKEDTSPISITPALAIPPWQEVKPLLTASSSVFCRALVLQASLSAAAAVAARGGNGLEEAAASSVAAHQIGIQLWLLCSFFCDSLAAASQGLVADALGRKDQDGVIDISKTIFCYSAGLGTALALIIQVGLSSNALLNLFTQDGATQASLREIIPLIILAQPLNALVFAADGVIQGASEFPFQARAMALSGLTAIGTFFALEAFGAQDVHTLVHVWTAMITLQAMRGATSLWKLLDAKGPFNLLSLE